MIIGISGKKRAGKDLIGIIIQWLIFQETVKGTSAEGYKNFQEWVDFTDITRKSTWKIIKFADKLKDIVCLLIGCTRDQLESEKFKNTELGEEWWLYNLKAPNGEYFAINQTKEQLNEYKLDNELPNCTVFKYTPRKILQLLGTELFRRQFHSQTWVNATMADYKPISHNGLPIDFIINVGADDRVTYPKWIITDTRFLNEVKAIKDRDGIVIRVERPSIKSDDKHISETSLDSYTEFDYTIYNNGSREDLINKVKEILTTERII